MLLQISASCCRPLKVVRELCNSLFCATSVSAVPSCFAASTSISSEVGGFTCWYVSRGINTMVLEMQTCLMVGT